MKKYARIYLIYGLFLPGALFAAAFFCANSCREGVFKKTAFLMGTNVEVSISGLQDSREAFKAARAAFAEIKRIEDKFSAFSKEGVIGRINSLKPLETLDIDDETIYMIEESLRYNKLTDGAFDITVRPLVEVWGFSERKKKEPRADRIADALTRVGTGNIMLDKANKRISVAKDGVRLDLGGIAKGYASDMAIKALRERGVKNAIVNSGGDMYCLGRKSPLERWKVGIRHPRMKDGLIGELLLEDAAIVTSGDYEKSFKSGGRVRCHIIDPKTGMPVGSKPASVTMVAKSSMEADALATAFMVLGYERGRRIMEENFDGGWMVISEKESGGLEVKTSENFKDRYAYKAK